MDLARLLRNRDEMIGKYQTPDIVAHAHQGLEAGYALLADIEYGLVVQFQGVFQHRLGNPLAPLRT